MMKSDRLKKFHRKSLVFITVEEIQWKKSCARKNLCKPANGQPRSQRTIAYRATPTQPWAAPVGNGAPVARTARRRRARRPWQRAARPRRLPRPPANPRMGRRRRRETPRNGCSSPRARASGRLWISCWRPWRRRRRAKARMRRPRHSLD